MAEARALLLVRWIDRAVPAAGAKGLRIFFFSLFPCFPTSDVRAGGREENLINVSLLVLVGLLSRRYGREGGKGAVWGFSLRVLMMMMMIIAMVVMSGAVKKGWRRPTLFLLLGDRWSGPFLFVLPSLVRSPRNAVGWRVIRSSCVAKKVTSEPFVWVS